MKRELKVDFATIEMDLLFSIHIPFVGTICVRKWTWNGGSKITIGP